MDLLRAKQQHRASGVSEEMGCSGCGISHALKLGGGAMWFKPFSITLEMKRIRTHWQVTIRIRFM
jgi:hypothetical protein